MKLFYTGAYAKNQEQKDPFLSLGNYASLTEFTNDDFSNLFSEVTQNTIKENKASTSVLAILNDSEATYADLYVTLSLDRDDVSRFKGALVEHSVDDCGDMVFPKLNNPNSTPANIPLSNCTSFYGRNKLAFDRTILADEVVEVFVDGNEVLDFIYADKVFYVTVVDDNYELRQVFNYDTEAYDTYLLQKDLSSFIEDVELFIGVEEVTGDLVHEEPVINRISAEDFLVDTYLGLYIQRTIDKKYFLKKDEKVYEEKLILHKKDFELDQNEIVELIIEDV